MASNIKTDKKVDQNFYGFDNTQNFTGYTFDEVLDVYFAQNRFYDPSIKRFTQVDPAKDGTNYYAYCGNNPVVNVDVWGLSGRVVFMQHGLNSNKDEFKVMVAYMVQKKLKAANEHE